MHLLWRLVHEHRVAARHGLRRQLLEIRRLLRRGALGVGRVRCLPVETNRQNNLQKC